MNSGCPTSLLCILTPLLLLSSLPLCYSTFTSPIIPQHRWRARRREGGKGGRRGREEGGEGDATLGEEVGGGRRAEGRRCDADDDKVTTVVCPKAIVGAVDSSKPCYKTDIHPPPYTRVLRQYSVYITIKDFGYSWKVNSYYLYLLGR